MEDHPSVFITMLLFLSFLIIFLSFYLFGRKSSSKHLPPGPRPIPIIGHLHLLQDPAHQSLQKLSLKYGPVMFLKFGARKVLVVSSPEAVEECLSKNDVIFANRPTILATKTSPYSSTPFALASYGDDWRSTKRLLNMELLSPNRLSALRYIREEEVHSLLQNILEKSTSRAAKVELKTLFINLSFNIILRMIAGKRYYGSDVISEEAKAFREMIGEVVELLGVSKLEDHFPFFEWMDIHGIRKKMVMQTNKMDQFIQKLVDDRRQNGTQANGSNIEGKHIKLLIDVMLSLQDTEEKYRLDESIRSVIVTLLLAGTETPATTLEWAMTLLLNHPEAMKKLQDEIDTCTGNSRLLDENDLPKLSYLQNVINETLRLCSPLPLLAPHESSIDCRICGYDIPKGTMLLINTWAIQRDPMYWKDANQFKPERFDTVQAGNGYNLIPFGMGRRACPGTNLGWKVLALALGSMIHCFNWNRGSQEMIDITEITGVTIRKKVPLEAICEPRQVVIDYFSSN